MYTEYVFENKAYEVALRDIKSILFDIVSQEEKNIAVLRERAFSDTSVVNAPAMQSLFVQQDERLRAVLGISDQLTRAIQEVDACSKQLRLIDQKTVQQVLAAQQAQPVQQAKPEQQVQEAPALQESVENALQGNATEEPVKEKEDEPAVEEPVVVETIQEGEASDTTDEPVIEVSSPTSMDDIADAMAMDEGDALAPEAAEAEKSGISTMTDDIIAAHSGEDEASEDPAIIITEDPVITNPVIPVETPAAETNDGEKHESLIIKYNDDISTIPEEPSEETTPAEGEQAEGEESKKQHESLIIKYNDEISTIPEEPTEEATEEKAEKAQATAPAEEPVLTPMTETSPAETTPVAEDAPVVEETETAPVAEETATTDSIPDSFMFRKRNADAPRGIMISKDQSSRLRGSLSVQTALLNAKGILQSSYSGEKQLEAMMEEANALYSQGKVAEAQDKIDEINTYTKGMTESVGIAA